MRQRKSLKILALAAAAFAVLTAGLRAQTSGFKFYGPLARVITPNGDQRNDVAFFCFENPADSEVAGRIYTLLGHEVASTTSRLNSAGSACPQGASVNSQRVTWDGVSNGSRVRSGVYVYRIEAEGRVFAGTLLVVR